MKKTPEELAQVWTVCYGIAFAMTVLGVEARGARHSPEELDGRARALADKALETVREKLGAV